MMNDRISLSIYLLNQTKLKEFEQQLVASHPNPVSLRQGLEGTFLPFPSEPREPIWMSGVRNLLDSVEFVKITSQSAGGLLLVSLKGDSFVICFGHAWTRLKPQWVVHDFGRCVVLNAITRESVLEVNAEQIFSRWHLARERAPRASDLRDFGIEGERDLVSAIEGIPSDSSLGNVIRGATSVRLKVSLASLDKVLLLLMKLYRSKKRKKEWPELHNLTPILDPSKTTLLEDNLDADLKSGQGKLKVVLFSPAARRADQVVPESYVIGRKSSNAPNTPYLTFDAWEHWLHAGSHSASVEVAKNTPVHLLDDVGEEFSCSQVFDCFCYETKLGKYQYILSAGIWYQAEKNFINSINRTAISLSLPKVTLPAWDGKVSEGEFNNACYAANCGLLHFDAKNVMFGGGYSRFEFCDLMHVDSRTLYFVKTPSRSTGMSHLLEQARRTVELVFSSDDSFRLALKAKMINSHPGIDSEWLDERLKPGEWNICLVSMGRKAKNLPFFAKCGLARFIKEMESGGHSLSFQAV